MYNFFSDLARELWPFAILAIGTISIYALVCYLVHHQTIPRLVVEPFFAIAAGAIVLFFVLAASAQRGK